MNIWGTGLRCLEAHAVAEWCGTSIEAMPFIAGVTDHTPLFTASNPIGKMPLLQDGDVGSDAMVASAAAVCRYIAAACESPLYPCGMDSERAITRAQIDAWIDWTSSLDALLTPYVAVLCGIQPYDKSNFAAAEMSFAAALQVLDDVLSCSTYLVGNAVSLADVVVASRLVVFYLTVFGETEQKQYPNVARYLATMYFTPIMRKVFGELTPLAKKYVYSGNKQAGPAYGDGLPHPLAPLMDKLIVPWSATRVRAAVLDFFAARGHAVLPSCVCTVSGSMVQFAWQPSVPELSERGGLGSGPQGVCAAAQCVRTTTEREDMAAYSNACSNHALHETLNSWSFNMSGEAAVSEGASMLWTLLTRVLQLHPYHLSVTCFGGDARQGLAADEQSKDAWLQHIAADQVSAHGSSSRHCMQLYGGRGVCCRVFYSMRPNHGAAQQEAAGGKEEVACITFVRHGAAHAARGDGVAGVHASNGDVEQDGGSVHVGVCMRLEPLLAILQGKNSSYSTELFSAVMSECKRVCGAREFADKHGNDDKDGFDKAYRIVADNVRLICTAAVHNASLGENNSNGMAVPESVVRDAVQRSMWWLQKHMGAKEGSLRRLIDVGFKETSSVNSSHVADARTTLRNMVQSEESSFLKSCEALAAALKQPQHRNPKDKDLAQLAAQFGVPKDVVATMANDMAAAVAGDGGTMATAAAATTPRKADSSSKDSIEVLQKRISTTGLRLERDGITYLKNMGVAATDTTATAAEKNIEARVVALLTPRNGFVSHVPHKSHSSNHNSSHGGGHNGGNDDVGIVLDRTCFAASAPQHDSDVGTISCLNGRIDVKHCKANGGYVMHVGKPHGDIRVGDVATAAVDYSRRRAAAASHTLTHVLWYAMTRVLGREAKHRSSVSQHETLHIDYSFTRAPTSDELSEIERVCKEHCTAGHTVSTQHVPIAQAKDIPGIQISASDANGDQVAVVAVGVHVRELLKGGHNKAAAAQQPIAVCARTHVHNTREIHDVAVLADADIGRGIRRLSAVTGEHAHRAQHDASVLRHDLQNIRRAQHSLDRDQQLAKLHAKVTTAKIPASAKTSLLADILRLQEQIKVEQNEMAATARAMIDAATRAVNEAHASSRTYAVVRVDQDSASAFDCAALAYARAQERHSGIALLVFSVDAGKRLASVWASVPDALQGRLSAMDWVRNALSLLGGKPSGGSNKDAHGTGSYVERVEGAMDVAEHFAKRKLA